MAHRDLLNRYYYGHTNVPEGFEIERMAWRKGGCFGLFRLSTNGWYFRMLLWTSWTGGFSLSLQAPTWVAGYAKYGMLNALTLFAPKLDFDDGDFFPVIAKCERWSQVITDKELIEFGRAEGLCR